jgi:hypothetical protein
MIHMLTGWSRAYESLAQITYPGKLAYAKKWGYECEFFLHHENESRKMAWERPAAWLRALQKMPEYDWLWFTGTDVLLTNPEKDIAHYADNHFDGIFANDCNVIQSDSFLMKANERTIELMEKLTEAFSDTRFRDEQEALNVLLSPCESYYEFYATVGFNYGTTELQSKLFDLVNHTDAKIKVVTAKYFNSMHGAHIPKHGPATDGSRWSPDDLVLHMGAQTLDYRLKHLGDYVPREHKLLKFETKSYHPQEIFA